MKALVYTGPKSLEYKEVEEPVSIGDEVLVRVEAAGICGSDVHAFLGHDERRPAPLILGHEAAGKVVNGPMSDQRVVVNPLVVCGNCRACNNNRSNLCENRQIISMPPRQGAFAQELVIPSQNVIAIADGTNVETAALTEPFACGWHAVRLVVEILDVPVDDTQCLVIGGGAIGVGAALSLYRSSAKQISLVETNQLRVDRLKQADQFCTEKWDAESTAFMGDMDIVIDAVGLDQTRNIASRAVRPGGVIATIGLGKGNGGLDIRRMTLQEVSLLGTYTYTESDFANTANAIFKGEFGKINFHEIRPLSEGVSAFDDIVNGTTAASKIILKPE